LLEQSAEELYKMVKLFMNAPRPTKWPIVIFANKQDLPNALSPQEIREAMQVESFPDCILLKYILIVLTNNGIEWYVCGSNARTGKGLSEGLDWLINHIYS
jgi:signal recognition particle receptor subunit beta